MRNAVAICTIACEKKIQFNFFFIGSLSAIEFNCRGADNEFMSNNKNE